MTSKTCLAVNCKYGYISWGKILWLYHQDVRPFCHFRYLDLYTFIPVSWCNFHIREMFLIKAKLQKTRKFLRLQDILFAYFTDALRHNQWYFIYYMYLMAHRCTVEQAILLTFCVLMRYCMGLNGTPTPGLTFRVWVDSRIVFGLIIFSTNISQASKNSPASSETHTFTVIIPKIYYMYNQICWIQYQSSIFAENMVQVKGNL